MKLDRSTWISIAAGTVAAIAVTLSAVQCSDNAKMHRNCDSVKQELADLNDQVSVNTENIKILGENDQKLQNQVNKHTEHINQLENDVDSLKIVVDSTACKCEKPVAKQPAVKKPAAKKPAAKKPVVKEDPKTEPSKNCDVKVEVVSGEDKVVVHGNGDAKADQTVVITGNNNGTVIVNSEGIVKTTPETKSQPVTEHVHIVRYRQERCR